MKILLEQEKSSTTILLKDITEKHLVVGVINGYPCILGKGSHEHIEKLTFFLLYGAYGDFIITNGNGFTPPRFMGDHLHYIIKKNIEDGNKVEAFENKDWRKALQWLIDNTLT